MSIIKIGTVLPTKNGGFYASTLTGDRYSFANQSIAESAKDGSYAWSTSVTRSKTYKVDETGNRLKDETGAFVLVDCPAYTINQITKIFKDFKEAVLCKNEAKLMLVQEKAIMKEALGEFSEELTEADMEALLAVTPGK
jgi:hypothetical protein